MNKKIFAAALAMIALPAFATGDHGKPSKPSTPSTTVSNRISNDVRNTAVAFANSRASSSAVSGSVSGATGGAGGQGGRGDPAASASVVKGVPVPAAPLPPPPPAAPSAASPPPSPTKSPSRPSLSEAYILPHLAWEPVTSAGAIHSSTSEAAPAGKVPNVTSGKQHAAFPASASPQMPSLSSAPVSTPRPRLPVSPSLRPRNNNHDQALHRGFPPSHP